MGVVVAMKDSFWAGGGDAYGKAIREHYQTQIEELTLQLTNCTDEQQRSVIQENLNLVDAEYREKLRASGRLIF